MLCARSSPLPSGCSIAHQLANATLYCAQVSLWGYNLDNEEDTILARSNGAHALAHLPRDLASSQAHLSCGRSGLPTHLAFLGFASFLPHSVLQACTWRLSALAWRPTPPGAACRCAALCVLRCAVLCCAVLCVLRCAEQVGCFLSPGQPVHLHGRPAWHAQDEALLATPSTLPFTATTCHTPVLLHAAPGLAPDGRGVRGRAAAGGHARRLHLRLQGGRGLLPWRMGCAVEAAACADWRARTPKAQTAASNFTNLYGKSCFLPCRPPFQAMLVTGDRLLAAEVRTLEAEESSTDLDTLLFQLAACQQFAAGNSGREYTPEDREGKDRRVWMLLLFACQQFASGNLGCEYTPEDREGEMEISGMLAVWF